MSKTIKRVVSVVLACAMLASVVATTSCSKKEEDKSQTPEGLLLGDYTYSAYTTALATNWNPHTWEMNNDSAILSYTSSPFVDISVKDSEEGVYQWVYEMATSVEDVTASHQDDLTKYNVVLPAGQSASETTSGYVFQIKLNKDAKWDDGTAITADDYIKSMELLLSPKMHNYRANLYISGDSAVAGALNYYYADQYGYSENYNAATESFNYDVSAMVKGDDGVYATADGLKAYISLTGDELSWLGGYTLGFYVDYYGETYFDVAAYESLTALADENGRVALTDESLPLLTALISVPAWGEGPGCEGAYIVLEKYYPNCTYDETVGCYKVDDYTFNYVCYTQIDPNYFLTSLTSNWLVKVDLYESLYNTSSDLLTTTYGSSVDTSASYGPYKVTNIEEGKVMILERNETWYGWSTTEDGQLYSMTNFLVDGEYKQQYITTKIEIEVVEDESTQESMFMKGEFCSWVPSSDKLSEYTTSTQMYQEDETYTMRFFFNTNLEALQEMDASKGNTNSVVLSNANFRKAMSLAIDRAEFVTATPGYKAACFLMNNLYFYNVFEDPTSSYRSSDEAMQAICNLYGVEYGEGKIYKTLTDAYESVTGYNLTEAKNLMKTACQELVDAGLYTAGQDIYIKIGWAKGALGDDDNAQIALINKYVRAALEGSGFGNITFEGVGNIENRYDAVPDGEYAIGYGAWGGAAFYPFTMFQVYMDPDMYTLNEGACYDPTTETLTLTVNGEQVTKTWQEWSGSMDGTGDYATADFSVKLSITAQLEEAFLGTYYCIPLCGTTICEILSYKVSYFTNNYNIMYGFGGFRLMTYNYTDSAWADYVAAQGGTLNYK